MNMKAKLNDQVINAALRRGRTTTSYSEFIGLLDKKQSTILDSELKGFHIARTGVTKCCFKYSYSINKKQRVQKLGEYPAINTAQAKELYRISYALVLQGVDPMAVVVPEVESNHSNLTLGEFIGTTYTTYLNDGDAQHPKKIIRDIEVAFSHLFNTPLRGITQQDLVNWVTKHKKLNSEGVKGYKKATITKKYGALKTALSMAVREGLIDSSPFDRMPKLTINNPDESLGDETRIVFTKSQQKVLLALIDEYDQKLRDERSRSIKHGKPHLPDLSSLNHASHHRPILLLLYYMGLRQSDVLSLRWGHIIKTKNGYAIRKVMNKTSAKITTPFTLPLSEPIAKVLEQWSADNNYPDDSQLVFHAAGQPDKELSDSCLRKCWKWIKRNSDGLVPEQTQLYSFRHSFCSWLLLSNIPIKTASYLMGHSSTQITEQYAHIVADLNDDAAAVFANLLNDTNQ